MKRLSASRILDLKKTVFGAVTEGALYGTSIWMPLQSVHGMGWGKLSHWVCLFCWTVATGAKKGDLIK